MKGWTECIMFEKEEKEGKKIRRNPQRKKMKEIERYK